MQPVLTPDEMGEADRRAIAAGTPESVLVERAGRAVARQALTILGGAYGRRVVVVCGKGNNGADGHVAARRLRARGVGVDEFTLTDGIDGLERACRRSQLAIDAMFGTGFRGELEGDARRVAELFASLPTLAIDIPSGVDGLTGEARGAAVQADATVCFAALKPGLLFAPGRELAGTVVVADIGINVGAPNAHVLDEADLWVPRRAQDTNKWRSGLLVIGGSTGMIGAPMMASHAAARSGAGMVVCALPEEASAQRASGSEIVTQTLPATDVEAKDIERFHAVAIGPGIGREQSTQEAVRRIVAECPVPIVVDADGLNALAADPSALEARPVPAILTPHAGEYARLAGAPLGPDRVTAARELATRLHAIVVLKGPGTVIADPDGRVVINRHDSPALATAGTGDVLTGIIGGLLANGAPPFTAAATGADLHGRAARTAGTGDALIATDLLGALPPTLATLRSGHAPGRT
jgi:NAD(P)H-hydrate epimerase